VTAAECVAAAKALRTLLANDEDVEFLLDCLDSIPDEMNDLVEQIEVFAKFHEKAAELGGYIVS
jgi:hypothetical protein